MNPGKSRGGKAFSLAEMLIVITVVGFLIALSAPNIFSMLRANELSTQGDSIRNNFSLAQQMALSTNQDVEVRIFKYMDEHQVQVDPQFRAIQFYQYDALDEDPEEYDSARMNMKPVTKVIRLSDPLVFVNERQYSNILTDSFMEDADEEGKKVTIKLAGSVSGSTAERLFGEGVKNAEYAAFRFRANGSTTLPKASSGSSSSNVWYLTMADLTAVQADNMNNFFTIQIDPYNGSIREFRP